MFDETEQFIPIACKKRKESKKSIFKTQDYTQMSVYRNIVDVLIYLLYNLMNPK